MIKYIITWVVVTTIQVNDPNHYTLNYKPVRMLEQQEFDNRDSAIKFFEKTKSNSEKKYMGMKVFQDYIYGVSIDSTSK